MRPIVSASAAGILVFAPLPLPLRGLPRPLIPGSKELWSIQHKVAPLAPAVTPPFHSGYSGSPWILPFDHSGTGLSRTLPIAWMRNASLLNGRAKQ